MQVELMDVVRHVLALKNVQLTCCCPPFAQLPQFDYGLRRALDPAFDWQQMGQTLLQLTPPYTLLLVEDTFGLHFAMFCMPDQPNAAYIAGPWRTGAEDGVPWQWLRANLGAVASRAVAEYRNAVPVQNQPQLVAALSTVLAAACPLRPGGPDFKIEQRKEFLPLDFKPDLRHFREPAFSRDVPMALLEERYDNENQLMEAVAQGDENKALALFARQERFRYNDGRFFEGPDQRKWGLVILNTLLRKALEKSKLHPYYLDQISEQMSRRIGLLDSGSARALSVEMIRSYCAYARRYSVSQYSPLIQKVINHINLNLHTQLSLKGLADMCYISPSYLSNLFKQEVGVTLIDYISTQRMRRAAAQLTDTNLPISAIAEKVGILDVNYFTKLFKKAMGATPTQYRKESRVRQQKAL